VPSPTPPRTGSAGWAATRTAQPTAGRTARVASSAGAVLVLEERPPGARSTRPSAVATRTSTHPFVIVREFGVRCFARGVCGVESAAVGLGLDGGWLFGGRHRFPRPSDEYRD
jgi:hypothetical protein